MTRLFNNDTWNIVNENHELEKEWRTRRVKKLAKIERIKDNLYMRSVDYKRKPKRA